MINIDASTSRRNDFIGLWERLMLSGEQCSLVLDGDIAHPSGTTWLIAGERLRPIALNSKRMTKFNNSAAPS